MLNAAGWPNPLRKATRNSVLQILLEIFVCPAELLNCVSREVFILLHQICVGLCAVEVANMSQYMT